MPAPPPPEALPLVGRLALGGLGVALLVGGARLYRLAVVAPGILVGSLVAALVAHATGLGPVPTLGVAAVLAIAGAALCWVAEAAAVRIAGLVAGAGFAAAAWTLRAPVVPWWVPVAGAAVGLLLFPPLYRRALVLVTSALGALALCAAAGWTAAPLALVGLTVAGAVVQFAFGRADKPDG